MGDYIYCMLDPKTPGGFAISWLIMDATTGFIFYNYYFTGVTNYAFTNHGILVDSIYNFYVIAQMNN